MKMVLELKKMLAATAVALCMIFAGYQTMETYAANENAAVEEIETEAAVTVDANTQESDETVFFLIMGGGFLIILFAVVVSVASASSCCIIADQFDED